MKRFIFPLMAIACGPLLANDTSVWEYPDGSGVIPLAEDNIQMVAETVRIKVKKETRMEVEARFTFRNLSDRSVKVTMGFPFNENWGEMFWEEEESGGPNAKDSLRFVSLVDGKEVKVRLRPDLTESEKNPSWNKRFFFVWDVEFAPGQTRRLTTRYETDWDRWANVDGQFSYDLSYITTTGAAWAGRIGDAFISVEIPKRFPRPTWGDESIVYWKCSPGEPSANPDSSRLVWHFTDWEPDADIHITIAGQEYSLYRYAMIEEICSLGVDRPLTEEDIRKLFVPYGAPKRFGIRVLINTLYARAGHKFKDKDWDSAFKGFDWYKPRKSLSLSDLPESYQKTVEAARRVDEEQKAIEEKVTHGPYGRFMNEFAVIFYYPPYWNFGDENLARLLPLDREGKKVWLRLARNAFYARAGYDFEDPDLAEFFSVMPWYDPNREFEGLGPDEAEAVLNIIRYEEGLK